MIGIIDYGMGNIHSVYNAVKKFDEDVVVSSDIPTLSACQKLIFPGVGAFQDCMNNVMEKGLYEPIRKWVLEDKKPILGICLGMQVFFEEGYENGFCKGFNFLKGKVVRINEENLRIPHIGWNDLHINSSHSLSDLIRENTYVYFVHSYYASDIDEKQLLAYCQYGQTIIPAVMNYNNILACQFHPEKSGKDGLAILKYFVKEF